MSFELGLDALDQLAPSLAVDLTSPEITGIQPQVLRQEQTSLQLPYDSLKTATTAYCPEQVELTFPMDLPQFLNSQSSQGVHVDSIVLAAFYALLYRYTRQATLTIDLQVSEAGSLALQSIPLTLSLSSYSSIRSVVQDLSNALTDPKNCLESSRHGGYSNVMVSLGQPMLPATAVFQRLEPAQPDLHLYVISSHAGVQGYLQYNRCLFQPATIKRLAGHLYQVVEGLMADLDQALADLPLLTAAEARQILVEWASPVVAYPQQPIFTSVETHAVQRPDAIAVSFNNQQLTYGELNQRANQLAHHLHQMGVGPEVRVASCLEPCLEVVVGMLAILKAGGVYVPLDPSHPLERRTAILEDTRPRVLLTQSSLLSATPEIADSIFCFDRDWDGIQVHPTHNPNYPIDLNQTAYIIYTSGTTGKPKGVMASHHNLINYIWVAQEKYGFNAQDVMPAIARFTFSITLFELWSPLVAGGRLLLLERDHILDFKRMIQTLEAVTVIHTSPSLLRKLIHYIHDHQLEVERFHQLRHVSSGGDMVPADLLALMKQTFVNAEVFVIYGCSEISCMGCTYLTPRDGRETQSRVGKPFPNVAVRLVDPDQNLVPIGIPGEILFGGAGVNKGYLNRDTLTAERFITIDGQRYYRTGDLGRFDAHGNLEILGRSDFQIKLHGIRMEPAEIETTLRQVPGIREAVVTAQPLPGSGEKSLVAYLVMEAHHKPTTGQIRQFLNAKLPDYMVPSLYLELDAMPVNVNGKVDRQNLPVPSLVDLVDAHRYVAPHDEMEQQLVEMWESTLGVRPVGIRNDFFELGGNSLLAVQLLMQIEAKFGKTLSITALLQAPTVESLASLIRSLDGEMADSGLVPLRKEGANPPLFCLYGVLLYRELVESLKPDRPVYGVYLQEEVEILKSGQDWQDNENFSSVPAIAGQYLKTIRSLQPQGPYFLLGESFGGVIAYEMAQQLEAEGETVALVALLDSKAPNSYGQASLRYRFQTHLKLMLTRGPSYVVDKIKAREIAGKFKAKVKQLAPRVFGRSSSDRSTPIPPNPPTDRREEFRAQVSRRYRLTPYDGNVILFRASERDSFEVDPNQDMGWGAYANHLQVLTISGDHLGILKNPNVREIGNCLNWYLSRCGN